MPKLIKRVAPSAPAVADPFWRSPDGEHALYLGNVTDVLARLPERSVQCCVTSPPYWGLRSYDTGDSKHCEIGCEPSPDCRAWAQADSPGWTPCGQCFVCSMVAVFRGVYRVLRDDGVLWLNLGDTYSAGSRTGPVWANQGKIPDVDRSYAKHRVSGGLPGGNLVGVPWRTAFALQADGWILRSDLPWPKRSAMPESCRDRPAKALEYWFLFAKRPGYYFDMESVRKRVSPSSVERAKYGFEPSQQRANASRIGASDTFDPTKLVPEGGRNMRNTELWFQSVDAPHGLVGVGDELLGLDVTSRGYEGAHFATYSPTLIEPLVKAGTSERGACAECGTPWERVVEASRYQPEVVAVGVRNVDASRGDKTRKLSGKEYNEQVQRVTTGWQPGCECYGRFVQRVVTVRRPVSLERAAVFHGGTKGTAPGQNPHSDARPPGLAGPKGAGRNATGVHQGGVASSTLGVRDRSLPSNRNGITGSLQEERWVYESDLPLEDHPTIPCAVLDPFTGSGTTGAVCVRLGRRSVGIDLSAAYLREHAVKRIGQALLERNGPGELVTGGGERVEL